MLSVFELVTVDAGVVVIVNVIGDTVETTERELTTPDMRPWKSVGVPTEYLSQQA